MSKPDQYYYTDSIFQLELNLYNIRRELNLMIEEFEKEDCSICLQLKCRCIIKSPEKDSSNFTSKTSHGGFDNKSKDDTLNKAPPPEALPKPKFDEQAVENSSVSKEEKKHIEAWIEATKSLQNAKIDRLLPTDVLLPSLNKTWGKPRSEVKKEIVGDDLKQNNVILDTRVATANAVELFFNSFKVQPAVTAGNMAFISSVTKAFDNHKSRNSEYSYF